MTETQTLNKQQAAEYLGRSARSVNEYVRQEKLRALQIRGAHGTELAFEVPELERFKASMQTPEVRATVQTVPAQRLQPVKPPAQASQSLQPVRTMNDRPATLPAVREDAVSMLAQAIAGVKPGTAMQEIALKPLLTLEEARIYTGIPRKVLLQAMKAENLRGFHGWLGRGWRVRRADLEEWLKGL